MDEYAHLIILVYEEFPNPVLYSITRFSTCWILGLRHLCYWIYGKCLRKIFKSNSANDSLTSEAQHSELLDKNGLLKTCVELREIVDIF